MQYCTQCGREIEKGTSFCLGCGAKLEVAHSTPHSKEVKAQNQLVNSHTTKSLVSKKIKVLLFSTISLVVVIGVVYLILGGKEGPNIVVDDSDEIQETFKEEEISDQNSINEESVIEPKEESREEEIIEEPKEELKEEPKVESEKEVNIETKEELQKVHPGEIEPLIKQIRQEYNAINGQISSMAKGIVITDEGNKLQVFKNSARMIKKIIETTSEGSIEYYYDDSQSIFFIFKYKGKVENRFYFHKEQMIRWIDPNRVTIDYDQGQGNSQYKTWEQQWIDKANARIVTQTN